MARAPRQAVLFVPPDSVGCPELAGMVLMGEYTDGCVCAVPGKAASTRSTLVLASAEGAGGGAAGVMMQRQRQQQQHR